ncbi:DUF3892 domain-containing protein [Microcoleus sp. AT9_B5]
MTEKRRIVDAREDKDGNISDVLLDGNKRFTPIEKAIELTEKGKVEGAHVVHRQDGTEFLRTNPDGDKDNNLDTMAKN